MKKTQCNAMKMFEVDMKIYDLEFKEKYRLIFLWEKIWENG